MTDLSQNNQKKIVFITPHYLNQKRRTGFYWIADAFHQKNYQVLFLTSPISLVSFFNRDHRFKYRVWQERNKLIEKRQHFFSYVHWTWWHKVDLRLSFGRSRIAIIIGSFLELILKPLQLKNHHNLNNCKDFLINSDIIVFESSPSLELLDPISKMVNNVKFIYRVSDDLRMLKVHESTKKYETENLDRFHRISVPSKSRYNDLKKMSSTSDIFLEYHGVKKDFFDINYPNPYSELNFKKQVVFVGIGDVDYEAINQIIHLAPHWLFHIIGPLNFKRTKNVRVYGEITFVETIPFIKHADIGLQCRLYAKGAESFKDTLKVLQYTYCKLAIIAPKFLQTNRKNTFYYEKDSKKTYLTCITQADDYEPLKDSSNYQINTWNDIANQWTNDLIKPRSL